MFRSPSRNNRSKRIKLKHVLQICLLLGVCFWLIYQVKHSHDKKKEFDEKDAKISVKTESGGVPKFGRKDLYPRPEGVNKNEKHEEEEGGEEEENKLDEEEREEENNHEVKEQEEEENKGEEADDEERGGGDDEIDENDQEKSDGEADHEEEFIDEEKEREEDDETESEEKQSQVENENSSEDQDHDGDDQNTHEAREEHYKGDDASSAVTHDTQTIISGSEKLSSENTIEQPEMNILKQENKSNTTQEIDSYERTSEIKVGEGEMAKNDTSLIEISVEHKDNDSSTNTMAMGSSVTNSTMTNQSNVHPEGSNNTTLVSMEATNTSAEVSTEGHDIKEGTSGSSQPNGTVSLSDSAHAQNTMVNESDAGSGMGVQTLETEQTSNTSTVSESNQSDVNSKFSIKLENEDSAARDSSTSQYNSERAASEKITTEAEDGSVSSESKENIDATNDKKSDSNSESDGNDESSENSYRDETLDAVQHDPIDISDSHIGLDEKEVRTDLDTLPEIRTEGDNSDDTAAE
ncbi:uncharacterized protein LOC133882090 [Alnus glutinosa]|uniref:uncharacterized protein LOC133882090 n=1 Tax=Alnus glutinosa TaxID=3517 RepID=UPI002D767DE5|nr:uncharacterized protein LOC133882090 [Alnus glutinosa]XP_062177179.1 uncharacterized protein LOC133882090 [Alnus glutinosa]